MLLAAGIGYYLSQARSRARESALVDARAGRFANAETILAQWITKSPNDAEALEWLARGMIAGGRDEEALPYLDRSIAIQPQSRELRRIRFDLHRRLKNRELAYADGLLLLERASADPELRRTMMNLALSTAHFAEAEEHCQYLLNDAPKDRSLRLFLAEIRRNSGNEKGSMEILRQLVDEDKNDYGANLALGTLLHAIGKSEEAVPHLKAVYDNDPSRRRTCGQQLGAALAKIGRHAEADKVFAEMRRLQDTEIIRAAIQNRPTDFDLHVRLAESLLADGHTEDGLRLLEQVIAQQPRHAGAHRALATHYDKTGDATKAAAHRRLANSP